VARFSSTANRAKNYWSACERVGDYMPIGGVHVSLKDVATLASLLDDQHKEVR